MVSNFEFISILSLFLINVALSHDVIPKYGSKETNRQYVVLDTKDFAVDDKIYISVTTYDYCYDTYLYYGFYQSIDDKSTLRYSDYVYQSSSTTTSSFNYKEKYNYKIKKQSSNGNYLYLESSCFPPLFFENTESDSSVTVIIISVVVSVVVIVVFIIIFVCLCKRCRSRRGTIAAVPVGEVYGYSPYIVQPNVVMVQPVQNVQPYNANYIQNQNYAQNYGQNYNQNYNQNINNQDVQYNSAAAAQQASDYRINQDIKYEKPH